jgi:hypothetical protein
MKIFDFKNPKHVQILKEEVTRAKRLIREYNENEMWKNMPTPLRRLALSSADDDMGPDFADEYENVEWLNIPDTVTNRINLSNFALPKRISPYALADWLRSGSNRSKIGSGILHSGSNQTVDGVINFLERGTASQHYIATIIAELIERGIQINFKDLQEKPANDINITTGNITGIDPYSMPGGKPRNNWTGD